MNNVKNAHELSKIRLYLMRGLYALTFVGLLLDVWPAILFQEGSMDMITGVAYSFWGSYAILMGLGVRYPVKMLPMILLQLLYKSIWILGAYLPMSPAERLDPSADSFFWICVTAVIVDTIVIPWSYVYRNYVKEFLNFRKTRYASE